MNNVALLNVHEIFKWEYIDPIKPQYKSKKNVNKTITHIFKKFGIGNKFKLQGVFLKPKDVIGVCVEHARGLHLFTLF